MVTLMEPRVLFCQLRMAMPVSSASMLRASVAVWAKTDVSGLPISQRAMSTKWLAWFMKAPPSMLSVPRQSARL